MTKGNKYWEKYRKGCSKSCRKPKTPSEIWEYLETILDAMCKSEVALEILEILGHFYRLKPILYLSIY